MIAEGITSLKQTEFEEVAVSFAAFHREFAPLFGRKEAQRRSEQYLRGLLVQQTDRRNAENVAEAIEGATPRTLQRFLTEAPWSSEAVLVRLQRYLGGRLSLPEGVFILDDTGFAKQGRKSVGVARQYSGTLGKIGNCQVAVFLGYASKWGHALVDRALYLPRSWTEDVERCQAAGVPDDQRSYQSKTELALTLLRQARRRGSLSGQWVTADEDYGKVPGFRDALDAEGWWYVLEVQCTTQVFTQAAKTEVREWVGNGRPPTKTHLAAGEPGPVAVQTLAAQLPDSAWQELRVAEGAQGPRSYQFARHQVWEHRDGIPGRACWVVWRRNLDGSELKYYFSNAPADTPLLTLAQVGGARWMIETEFQTYKGEAGLDEYEARSWQSWHHHITMAMLAGAFLLTLEQDWGEKDAPGHPAADQSSATATAAAA
jgi:SRSO17 transposase